MKPSLLIVTLVALAIAAAVASSRLVAAPAAPHSASPTTSALYGHIKSLTRSGRWYRLRFDPAWWLSGSTAEQARYEDTGSRDPSDYYIVEEGHRLLTYLVNRHARVTVVTNGAHPTRISVAELAQIVKGRNPRHRRGMEPKAGFWLRTSAYYPNPAVALDQQYQP